MKLLLPLQKQATFGPQPYTWTTGATACGWLGPAACHPKRSQSYKVECADGRPTTSRTFVLAADRLDQTHSCCRTRKLRNINRSRAGLNIRPIHTGIRETSY